MTKMETIKYGSRGEAVKTLQKTLHLYEDGIFGKLTEESLKVWQKENGLTPDGICGQQTWAKILATAKPEPIDGDIQPTGGYIIKKSIRSINAIVVHCTATPEGRNVSVEQIRQMHKHNGWSDIGYHYVVLLDGSIRNGRDVHKSGAHVANHNAHTIGVSYVGGVEAKPDSKGTYHAKDTRTPAQKIALIEILTKLKRLYPKAEILGHRDFTNLKACPSFNAKKEYANL